MTKTKKTIEGLERIKIACFKNSMVTGVSIESKQVNIPEVISQSIQWGKALDQAEEMLPKGEICLCGGYTSRVIDIAQPILAKKILECEEKDKRIEELEKQVMVSGDHTMEIDNKPYDSNSKDHDHETIGRG